MGLAFNLRFMLSIEKLRLREGKKIYHVFGKIDDYIILADFSSLTLLWAYPSCSGNTHREHGASLLVSTQSESEP